MLTHERRLAAIAAPCVALTFLVDSKSRHVGREQMKGFSDAAIFYRWKSLCWTFQEPEVISLLSKRELKLMAEFNEVFESIHWLPMESHLFISDVSDAELDRLVPSGARLLKQLARRKRRMQLFRYWSSWWSKQG